MVGRGQNRFCFHFRLILLFSFLFFRLSLSFSFRLENQKKIENDFRKLEIIIFVFIHPARSSPACPRPCTRCYNTRFAATWSRMATRPCCGTGSWTHATISPGTAVSNLIQDGRERRKSERILEVGDEQ
jgi:hypothetical protein